MHPRKYYAIQQNSRGKWTTVSSPFTVLFGLLIFFPEVMLEIGGAEFGKILQN